MNGNNSSHRTRELLPEVMPPQQYAWTFRPRWSTSAS